MHNGIPQLVVRFVDAVFMFRPSRTGVMVTASCALFFGAMGALTLVAKNREDFEHGEDTDEAGQWILMFALCNFFGNPLTRVCAHSFSATKKGSACRCFALFLLDEFVVAFILIVYSFVFLEKFTESETSLFKRLLYQICGPLNDLYDRGQLRWLAASSSRRAGRRAAPRDDHVHNLRRLLSPHGATHAVVSE